MNKQERPSVSSSQRRSEALVCYLQENLPTFESDPHWCTLVNQLSPRLHSSFISFPSLLPCDLLLCCSLLSSFLFHLFLSPSSFSYSSISTPPSLTPSLSVSHNTKWWRHSKCVRAKTGPGVGKRRQTKVNRAHAGRIFFLNRPRMARA